MVILNDFPICSNHLRCKWKRIANGSAWVFCPKYFFPVLFPWPYCHTYSQSVHHRLAPPEHEMYVSQFSPRLLMGRGSEKGAFCCGSPQNITPSWKYTVRTTW